MWQALAAAAAFELRYPELGENLYSSADCDATIFAAFQTHLAKFGVTIYRIDRWKKDLGNNWKAQCDRELIMEIYAQVERVGSDLDPFQVVWNDYFQEDQNMQFYNCALDSINPFDIRNYYHNKL